VVRKAITNHRAVAHSVGTLERIRMVRAGKKLTGLHSVFGAAYRLLDPAKPSPTVTRSGFRDFIHPVHNRLCTVRELARLQTFPDDHVFEGRRCDTYAKDRYVKQTQHEQLGNAVPPLLAEHVAKAIRTQLLQGRDVVALKDQRSRFAKIYAPLDRSYKKSERLGNLRNPLDELIYIMLSRRTREAQYQAAYAALAKQFRPWNKLLDASDLEVLAVLRPIGLANQRVKALREMLKTIAEDFGSLSLAPLRRMSYARAYHYLRSLPGVNDKTAKCVMYYALDLPALPIDTHTLRVSKRLGLVPQDTSEFLAPKYLDAVVPRDQRGRFHILTVLHGRAVCTPKDPRCGECPIRSLCVSRSQAKKSPSRRISA
jgi:endonuclease-3